MNILADGVEMDPAKQLKSIFDFLEALSETNNHHQKTFFYLYERLKELVYADNHMKGLKQLAEKSKNHLLGTSNTNSVKMTLDKTTGVTYRDLCQ